MNNDKDFINDPLFKDLRKFASKETGPENMPAELFTEFRNAQARRVRNKWTGRTVIGLVGAAIALPSLSYAHVLPKPIETVVNRVTHFVSTPVRVVASVITTEPLSTPSPTPTASPDPTPTASGNSPSQLPVAPTPKHSIADGEDNKVESHSENKKSGSKEKNSESDNQSKTEASKSEEVETTARPVATAPSVGSGESSNKSGGESKSSESGSKSGGESE